MLWVRRWYVCTYPDVLRLRPMRESGRKGRHLVVKSASLSNVGPGFQSRSFSSGKGVPAAGLFHLNSIAATYYCVFPLNCTAACNTDIRRVHCVSAVGWGEPAPRPLLFLRSSSERNALISAPSVAGWFLSSPLWRAFPEVRASRRRAFTSGSGRS